MAPGADGSAGKKKKKKKGGGDGEGVGCCSVARRDGESDESLTERTDHWRAIIFFTLAIFMVAPLFIIVYMYRSGQTSYGTAFDAFVCFFCLGLLLLLIAAYYARRLFRRGIVFCHRPPVLWTLCIICAIWLLIVGLARDEVQYHGGLAVRWRARLYLAVLGALCIYFGVMAIVFSRYEIAKAWPDHKLATPLMLLLAALTCGSAAITTANVRDTRGMEHELFKALLGAFIGAGVFLLIAAIYAYFGGRFSLRKSTNLPSFLWAICFTLVAAICVIAGVRDVCGLAHKELFWLYGVLGGGLLLCFLAALAVSPVARDDAREMREYLVGRVPRAAALWAAPIVCCGPLFCAAALGHHGLAEHRTVHDMYYIWGALGLVTLISAATYTSDAMRSVWAAMHGKRVVWALAIVFAIATFTTLLIRDWHPGGLPNGWGHADVVAFLSILGAIGLYFLLAALWVTRREIGALGWATLLAIFALIVLVIIAALLLLGLALPYTGQFDHHDPAQWRHAVRAFLWGLLWVVCLALLVALEAFLMILVELGRCLFAQVLVCGLLAGVTVAVQRTKYLGADAALVLYVTWGMLAWCFFVSAVIYCYCISDVGARGAASYGVKKHIDADGDEEDVATCCGCCIDAETSGDAVAAATPSLPRGEDDGGVEEAKGGDDEEEEEEEEWVSGPRYGTAEKVVDEQPESEKMLERQKDPDEGVEMDDRSSVAADDDAASTFSSRASGRRLPPGTPVEWLLLFGIAVCIGGLIVTQVARGTWGMRTPKAVVLFSVFGTVLWALLVWLCLHLFFALPLGSTGATPPPAADAAAADDADAEKADATPASPGKNAKAKALAKKAKANKAKADAASAAKFVPPIWSFERLDAWSRARFPTLPGLVYLTSLALLSVWIARAVCRESVGRGLASTLYLVLGTVDAVFFVLLCFVHCGCQEPLSASSARAMGLSDPDGAAGGDPESGGDGAYLIDGDERVGDAGPLACGFPCCFCRNEGGYRWYWWHNWDEERTRKGAATNFERQLRNLLWALAWMGLVAIACVTAALASEMVTKDTAIKVLLVTCSLEVALICLAMYHSGTVPSDLKACDAYCCGSLAAASSGGDDEPDSGGGGDGEARPLRGGSGGRGRGPRRAASP